MIRVPVAIFDNLSGASLTMVDMNAGELHDMAGANVTKVKEDQPLYVYGKFGGLRTADGSLRHDKNLLMRTGWTVDHDAGSMPFKEMRERCNDIGLASFGYTTARNMLLNGERWRAGGPFSRELAPTELPRQMARINGLFGGCAAPESGKLTQSWFIGRVDGVPFDRFVGDGDACLDELDALDAAAISIGAPTPPRATAGTPDYGALSRDALEELITTGAHYFGPSNEGLRRDAYAEIPQADAEANLRDLFDQVPPPLQNREWSKARASIGRWAQHVYNSVAKRKGRFFRSLVGHLQETDPWRLAIRFNQFSQQLEVASTFPPVLGQPIVGYRPLRDPLDILEAMMQVQEEGFPTAGKVIVTDAIVVVAEHRAYHPVQKWLRDRTWDGTERINKLLLDYFPADRPPESDPQARDDVTRYLEKVGECFMVGAVARALQPGCKVDCLPCLVSPQGWDKSKGIAALVPDPAWYFDDLSTNVADRDAKESLSGKWLIELSEFPHVRRDIERVKAFFSRQVDRYRRAYGRLNTDHPRQCVFIASANELEFIDMTGNRRIWPIRLARSVDVAAIERDRDELWGEAMHWYSQGFEWWLPPALEVVAGQLQDAFVEEDIWDELILEVLDKSYPLDPPGNKEGTRPPFTLRAVIEGMGFCFDQGEPNCAKKGDEARAARRLRRLGYQRDPHRSRATGRAPLWVSVRTL